MDFKKILGRILTAGLVFAFCVPIIVNGPIWVKAEGEEEANISESSTSDGEDMQTELPSDEGDAPKDLASNVESVQEDLASDGEDTQTELPSGEGDAPKEPASNAESEQEVPTSDGEDTQTDLLSDEGDASKDSVANVEGVQEAPASDEEDTQIELTLDEEDTPETQEVLGELNLPMALSMSEESDLSEISDADEADDSSLGEEEREEPAPKPPINEIEMNFTVLDADGKEIDPTKVEQGNKITVRIKPTDIKSGEFVTLPESQLQYHTGSESSGFPVMMKDLLKKDENGNEYYEIQFTIGEGEFWNYPFVRVTYVDGMFEQLLDKGKFDLEMEGVSIKDDCNQPSSNGGSSSGSSGNSSSSSDSASDASESNQELSESGSAISAAETVAPANTVTISGGKQLQSTVAGNYTLQSMNGIAITTPIANVVSAVGLSEADIARGTNVKFYVCDSRNREMKTALREIASTSGKNVVAYIQADLYTITKQGAISSIRSTLVPIQMVFGVPVSLARTEKAYSVICIDENGKVVTFEDLDTDNTTITINANVFGTYAIVY